MNLLKVQTVEIEEGLLEEVALDQDSHLIEITLKVDSHQREAAQKVDSHQKEIALVLHQIDLAVHQKEMIDLAAHQNVEGGGKWTNISLTYLIFLWYRL